MFFNVCFCCFATVVPDDIGPHGAHEDHQPRSLTPPTPPVHAEQSPSPPPSPRPMRQRAVAQLRPVSVPEIVRAMAGSDPTRQIADFDRHYMYSSNWKTSKRQLATRDPVTTAI